MQGLIVEEVGRKYTNILEPNAIKTIENGKRTTKNLRTVFTSSTCSVVNGPPYFDLPRSIREGMSSSQYVKALRLIGALCLAANLRTW